MTAPFALSTGHVGVLPELPVSTELLRILESFGAQASVIFEELSRSSGAGSTAINSSDAGSAAGPLSSSTSVRALHALSDLDEQLAFTLQRAKLHEANQRKIEALQQQLVDYELEWRKEVAMLEGERVRLHKLVDRGVKDSEAIDRAGKAALKPSTILSYARMLAPYTSAPPRMKSISGDDTATTSSADPANLPGSILPYPTEESMRRGRLAFAQVSDVGETTVMTGVKPTTPPSVLDNTTHAKPVVQPVAAPTQAARKPLAAVSQEEEEEDFAFDLDLNPDL